MAKRLKLPKPVSCQLRSWAREAYPMETCGVLIGRQTDSQVRIHRAMLARNDATERAHDRYQLNGEDLLAADRAAEAEGLEIVGIWHTHPDHPARPSEADQLGAWGGWSYLILSITAGRAAELRAWRLVEDRFEEETIQSWQP